MNSNMDEAARFLRDRLGKSTQKAGTHSAVTGETVVINHITNHGSGSVHVCTPPRTSCWQWLVWLALAAGVFLAGVYGIKTAAAVDIAAATIVCDSVAGSEGVLRTSCVAIDQRPSLWSNHATLGADVLAALTSAANACISAFYPSSSGFIHALPAMLTPPVGSQASP